MSQRVLASIFVLGFFLISCSAAPGDSHPPQTLSYASTWEYRWGDSPRGPHGELLWAQPELSTAFNPTPWNQTTSPFERLPGRNGSQFLWLRTKLKGSPLRDGVLYVRPVDRLMEAYLDGELIYQFGDMRQEPPYRFIGFRPHFIALPAQYQGKVLALRVYSELNNIGPSGQVWLAERAEVVKELFLHELERLFIGGLLTLLGLAAISLYLLRKEERAYLTYGCFAVSIGVYSISQIQVQSFLLDWPLLWAHLELAALFLAMIFLCSYLEHMFGRGPLGLVRALRIAHTVFAVGAAAAVLTRLVPLWKTVPPFQVLFLFDLAYLTCFVIYVSVLGNVEVRIFALGFVIAAGLALIELLGSYRIVKKTIITHYSMAAFTLSLGAILARRFLSVHKRLRDYSSVLQLSLASISAFDPDERTHVALEELVRIQRARRALLFQVEDGNNQLTLTAGRDDRGADLGEFRDFDKQSIDQAFARRTPIIVQREAAATAAPRSIMAAPILTGNKVLGVLYLETEGTRRTFQPEDQEILLGLGSQIASTLVSSRAMRLELDRALAHRRLHEQRELLDAAGRMAKGDLDSPIVVPEKHELAPLAGALDGMRQDLRSMQEELKAKVAQLVSRNQEVQLLNDELRRQIEQRSRRLLDILLPKDDALLQAAQLMAGSLLGDCYRVLRVLGKGGMGVVYEVERTTDCRRLAAKVLSAQPDRTAIGRFVREAQILARLDHPNLIAISDIDVTSSGVLFIVMELVDGSSLGQHRAEFGQANLQWELHILRQVAQALVALHAQGVVHRDLKPENVLLTRCPEGALPGVKLADFGISILLDEARSARLIPTPTPAAGAAASQGAAATAKTEDRSMAADAGALATKSLATEPGQSSAQALTKTGMIVGTPLYMAPELWSGSKNAQPPADIFSLGVIAFELLTAQLPFARPAIVARAMREEVAVPALSQLRPDLPPRLSAMLERCLSAEPENRPTAQQVAQQLVAP